MNSNSGTSEFFEVNIAAASYEGSLFSWKGQFSGGVGTQTDLEMTSGFHCSQGSIKAVAVSGSGSSAVGNLTLHDSPDKRHIGKYLACGGNDERIRFHHPFYEIVKPFLEFSI